MLVLSTCALRNTSDNNLTTKRRTQSLSAKSEKSAPSVSSAETPQLAPSPARSGIESPIPAKESHPLRRFAFGVPSAPHERLASSDVARLSSARLLAVQEHSDVAAPSWGARALGFASKTGPGPCSGRVASHHGRHWPDRLDIGSSIPQGVTLSH